jgi:cyclopropane-fatty-acyl-phospholipid synthase
MEQGPPSALDRALLRTAMAALGRPAVAVSLWDGYEVPPPAGPPVARIRLGDAGILRALLRSPDLAFGDGYMAGRVEVEGDLARACEALIAAEPPRPARWVLTALARRPRLPNFRGRARENVQHHYDLGNDFYALWLDERMVYTCAYFERPEQGLEEAQLAKLDHVCRKLRLRPGERVVEAGAGWGALALHMAERYGVRVRAYNVSREQVAFAREAARRRGLEGRVEFVDGDWREITGRYDAFVSVGMLEHVGLAHFDALGRQVERSLAPAGRGLLHFIGHTQVWPVNPWLAKRIFPGCYIPALSEALPLLERHRLAVADVENLRRHYARTLEHWSARFERQLDAVKSRHGDTFVRAWRLYLASSLAAFRAGTCQLYQVLFARRDDAALPWTRARLYAPGAG